MPTPASIIDRKLTVAEFLALPEGDITYELVAGYAVPKDRSMSPRRFHSRLQPILWRILEEWCSNPHCLKPGAAYTEWAIILHRQQREWIPIPDVTYLSFERLPLSDSTGDTPCLAIPEWVVEILSPSQTMGEMTDKALHYLATGIPRVWVVDPSFKSITVFYPDAAPKNFTGSQVLRDDFLPGLEVIPQELFAQAHIP